MLIRNAAIFLIARGGPGLLNFLALSLFTRLLAPDEFGRFAVVNAGLALAMSVGFHWLRMAVLRFYGGRRTSQETLRATVLVSYLGLIALALVVAAAVALLAPGVGRGLVALAFGILCAQTWFELNLEFLTVRQEPLRYGLFSLVRAATALAISTVLAMRGLGAAGLLTGALIGYLLPSLWVAAAAWRSVSLRDADRQLLAEFVRYGLPFTAAFALEFVVSTSDRLLLGAYHGTRAVGEYAAGYDLTQQTLGMLMIAVNLAGYPIAVRAYETGGIEGARAQLARHATALLAIALPAGVGLALLADSVTSVFFGPAYRAVGSATLPWIAAAALLWYGKGYYLDLAFQLSRNTSRQIVTVAVGAVVNTALNLALIPRYGVMGAAYSTLIAYAAAFVAAVWLGHSVCRLPTPWSSLARIGASTLLMAAALVPLRRGTGVRALALQVVVGASVYVASAFALDVGGVRRAMRARREPPRPELRVSPSSSP